jgi:hypothetical protein
VNIYVRALILTSIFPQLSGTWEARSSKPQRNKKKRKFPKNPVRYIPKRTYAYCPVSSMDPILSFLYTLVAQPSPTIHLPLLEFPKPYLYLSLELDAIKFCLGRRFMSTKSGFIGLAPPEAKPGDTVAILVGAPVPHILRK